AVGRSHGVRIVGGTGDVMAGCEIGPMGNYAVWVEGGRAHKVISCDVESTGDGGVHLSGGGCPKDQTGGNSRRELSFSEARTLVQMLRFCNPDERRRPSRRAQRHPRSPALRDSL